MNILKNSFLLLVPVMLFSYGCRKDIKALEDFYEYVDIHEYAYENFGLLPSDTIKGGIYLYVYEEGPGPKPEEYDKLYLFYTGKLLTGSEFDAHKRYKEDDEGKLVLDDDGNKIVQTPYSFIFNYSSVITGWNTAFAYINRGSKAYILIPPEQAYGDMSQSKIPPNSPLRFDVELLWLKGDPGTEDADETESDPDGVIARMLGLIE